MKFDAEIKNLSNYGRPCAARFKLVRPSEYVYKVDPDLQARPDLANL
jgi:hypothetical protein